DAAEAESPEDASGEGAALFAGDKDVRAGRAFGEAEVAVLLDDELAAQGNHKENAEPAAEQRHREDAPERELRAEAQENQRGESEHYSGRERFSRRAGGLHDVVFQDGGAAEGAKNADGEDGDGDGGGDGEPGAEADVHGDRAEEQAEDPAEKYGAQRKFRRTLRTRHVAAEFGRRRRGTPWTVVHRVLPGSSWTAMFA